MNKSLPRMAILLGITFELLGCFRPHSPSEPARAAHHVELRFIHSPYADYLFYLLYRDTSRVPGLRSVPIQSIPTLDQLVALPEIAASARVSSYMEILPLADLYRGATTRLVTSPAPRILTYSAQPVSYDTLRMIVERGESGFAAFLPIWTRDIEPEELANIATWRDQAAKCESMDSLQALTRLSFPSTTLDVAAIYMHFSGSGNYTPMGVYSRTFDRANLSFTIGHEAMHLIVNPLTGHNWRVYPAARRTIALADSAHLSASDLDELLALLMQVKLPQVCGLTDPNRRISDAFRADSAKYRVLRALEDDWPTYRSDVRRWPTIIDYFLETTAVSLSRR